MLKKINKVRTKQTRHSLKINQNPKTTAKQTKQRKVIKTQTHVIPILLFSITDIMMFICYIKSLNFSF